MKERKVIQRICINWDLNSLEQEIKQRVRNVMYDFPLTVGLPESNIVNVIE